MSDFNSVIVGTGGYLPERIVTNAELAAKIDTSDEWIVERTGIRQRYIAGQGETTATLATEAARQALAAAGRSAADIDLIIVATTSPDNSFPASATKVQALLGALDPVTDRLLHKQGNLIAQRLGIKTPGLVARRQVLHQHQAGQSLLGLVLHTLGAGQAEHALGVDVDGVDHIDGG